MNKELIEKLKLATVAIGYAVPRGVPEWLGTGFLVSDGDVALTCHHVMEGQSATKTEEGVPKDLCCFMFKNEPEGFRVVKFPISKWHEIYDTHIESTYFGPSQPDVARLQIDTKCWVESTGSDPIPTVEIEGDPSCEVGDEVVVVGYPSPHNLIAQKTGKPNCLGPVFRFGRIAAVLPATVFRLPHLLAIDVLFTGGASGSPVLRLSDGKVIGMVMKLLPDLITCQKAVELEGNGKVVEREVVYPMPSGISYALPSNFFAEFATQSGDSGRVDF